MTSEGDTRYLVVEEVDEAPSTRLSMGQFPRRAESRRDRTRVRCPRAPGSSISESPLQAKASASLCAAMRDTISDVFAALGDRTRREIYEQLLEGRMDERRPNSPRRPTSRDRPSSSTCRCSCAPTSPRRVVREERFATSPNATALGSVTVAQ